MARQQQTPKKKYYTVTEANATLPLVRKIIGDIAQLASELRDRYDRLKELSPEEPTVNHPRWDEISELQAELDRGQEELNGYFAELSQLGIELKDPFTGLLDFPCWMENREVYLCWRQGESEVGHWHELDAGFAGRQKISPDLAGAERIGYPRQA
jgi:hypothetical protein